MKETVRWSDSSIPIRIEYSKAAIDQIREKAAAGLAVLPQPAGVGGLLLGEYAEESITLLDSIEILCSHSLGPEFILTNAEIERSWKLFGRAGSLTVVGWYCSKPRGELSLSEPDQKLYKQLLPRSWQIAMVLRTGARESVRAAIFFRNAAGEVVKSSERDLIEERVEPEVQSDGRAEPVPSRSLFASFDPPQRRKILPWVIAGVLLVAGGAGFATRDAWMPRPPLKLTAQETDGRLIIAWNPAALRGIEHASVFINDGDPGQTLEINLDPLQLKAGSLPWYRKSGHVKARLVAGSERAVAEFDGPAPVK
jgi:proteasome lid subunit RPN8/RPN11